MAKNKKRKNDKFYLIGVVVILIAGFVIFFINLIQGENLFSKRLDVDFEQYLDTKNFNPYFHQKLDNLAKKVNEVVESEQKAKAAEALEPEAGVYFSDFFLKENPIETYNYINEFWNNINASEDVRITDLYAKNCFIVKIPAENREESMLKLKENEQIKELQVIEPPHWKVCYTKSYYPEQIDHMYASGDIEFLAEENEGDYIARLENDVNEDELKKIEEMYSDVVKIKD